MKLLRSLSFLLFALLPALAGYAADVAPAIATAGQPLSTAAVVGGSASFTVTATGSPAPTYQWRRNGYNLAGKTSATLTLTNLKRSDADLYDVVVSNGIGSPATSFPARLAVTPVAYPDLIQRADNFDLAIESDSLGSINAMAVYQPVAATPKKYIVVGDWVRTDGDASMRRVVRLNSNGTVDTSFKVNVNSIVNTVVVVGDQVIIGGNFSMVNGTECLYLARLNANGTLDTTFNAGGVGANSPINVIVPVADNKFLLGGAFTTYNGATVNRIVRITDTGARDTAWPTGSTSGVNNTVFALAVDPAATGASAGRFVVGGQFSAVGGGTGGTLNRIGRFNANGTVDSTFTTALGTGFNNSVLAVAFEPGTSDFVAGGFFSSFKGANVSNLARIKSDVSLDGVFLGGGGVGYSAATPPTVTFTGGGATTAAVFTAAINATTTQITNYVSVSGGAGYTSAPTVTVTSTVGTGAKATASVGGGTVNTVLVAPSNTTNGTVNSVVWDAENTRWLIGGSFTSYAGVTRNRIAAISATGVLDATFNPNANGSVLAILPESGTVLLGGGFSFINGTTSDLRHRLVTRIGSTSTGVTESGFKVEFRAAGFVSRVLPLSSGKLLIAGNFSHFEKPTTTQTSNLAVLNADLSLATAFPFGTGPNGAVLAAEMQGDGKIVLAGQFSQWAGQNKRVVRVNDDATLSLDGSFSGDNTAINNAVNAIALIPGGGMYVGGAFNTSNTSGNGRGGVIRLTNVGAIDLAFNAGPNAFTVNALALQPDGKVLAGGAFNTVNGSTRGNLVRLTTTGAVESVITTGVNGTVRAMALSLDATDTAEPNGKLLIAGDFSTYNNATANRIVRIKLSDTTVGTVDGSFAPGNTFSNNIFQFTPQDPISAQDPAGRLLVWGYFFTNPGNNMEGSSNFARISSTGVLDPSARLNGVQSANLSQPTAMYVRDDGSLLIGSSWLSVNGKEVTGLNLFNLASEPQITTQPTDQVAAVGATVTFTVAASGSPAPQYQWFRNGVMIPGASSATYSIPNAGPGDVADYTAVAYNDFGDARSDTVSFHGPNPAPTINTQPPVSVTPVAGSTAMITVSATATGMPQYQWYRNGALIAGATSSTLTLIGANAADHDGQYGVRVSDGLSVNYSDGFEVKVRPATYPGALQPSASFNAKVENSGNVVSLVAAPGPDGKFYGVGTFNTVNDILRYTLARFNADGSVDDTFTPAVISGGNTTTAVVQADGKVVIGGGFLMVGGVSRPYIARLNTNGTLDTTFLPKGGGPETTVLSLALMGDKIVVGGFFENFNGAEVGQIVRLKPDGTVDPTFVTSGGFNTGSSVNTLLVVGDKIYAGGIFTTYREAAAQRIIRLKNDGSPDTDFAVANAFDASVLSLAYQSWDNKLVVGGSFTKHGPTATATTTNRIARLDTTNGALDTAFANAIVASGSGLNGPVNVIALQGDHSIVVGGSFSQYSANATVNAGRIARFSAAGAIDTTFTPPGSTVPFNGTVSSLLVQSSAAGETILAGGNFTQHKGLPRGGLVRLTNAGGVASGFTASVRGGGSGAVFALVPLPGGKWLAGGSFTHINNMPVANIARLNANGSVDTSFTAGFDGQVYAIVRQPDGRFVVGGNFTHYNTTTTTNYIARLGVDGALDTGFGLEGGFNSTVFAMLQQGDGHLVVGGGFTVYGDEDGRNRIIRLDPNGQIDYFFDTGDGFNGAVTALAFADSDDLLAGGSFTSFNGTARKSLARLKWEGQLDGSFVPPTDFNGGGITTLAWVPGDESVLVGGTFSTYSSVDTLLTGFRSNGVAKLSKTGALVTDFAPFEGLASVPLSTSSIRSSFAVQADGKIVVVGQFLGYDGETRVGLARLNANGRIDQSFGASFVGVGTPSASPNNPIVYTADGKLLLSGLFFNLPGGVPTGLIALEAGPAPRAILRQPAPTTTVLGGGATFSVVAVGSGPVTYQWKRNGADLANATARIAGAQRSTLVLSQVLQADAGDYTVVVTDANGFTTSATATLSLPAPLEPFALVAPPQTSTVAFGQKVTLSVNAVSDFGNLTFVWRKFGQILVGKTGPTLEIDGTLDAAGFYDVIVSDGITTKTSAVAQISVVPSGPPPAALLPRTAFNPKIEQSGVLFAFATLPTSGKFYAAGSFTSIDGVTRYSIARFLANGTIDPDFNAPVITGAINAIAVQGLVKTGETFDETNHKVVIGGNFGYVDSVNSFRLGRLNANGTVDTTLKIGSGVSGGNVNALAVDSSNRILVAGNITGVDGVFANRILRLGVNGEPDVAFATALGTGFEGGQINAVQLQGEKIVVGGTFTTLNGQVANRIARLTATGAPDDTFVGGSGFEGTGASVNAIVIQDGLIVVGGGFATYKGDTAQNIARIGTDGTRDTATDTLSFATGFTGGTVNALAVEKEGTGPTAVTYLVVGGNFTGYKGTANINRLARIKAVDGVLDTALASAIGTASGAGVNGIVRAIAIQPGVTQNSILVGGGFNGLNTSTSFAFRYGFARFTAVGALDVVAPSFREPGQILAIQPVSGGNFVIGGQFAFIDGVARNNLARLTPAGAVDPNFVTGNGPNGMVRAIVEQPDGKIVIGGTFTGYGATTSNVLRIARIKTDGSLDTTFVTSGTGGFNGQVNVLAIAPDSGIIVGGNFTMAAGTVATTRIARVSGTDGALDTSFNSANGGAFDGSVNALLVQRDGKIVAGGGFSNFNNGALRGVARLNSTGGLDTGFKVGPGIVPNSANTFNVSSLLLQADDRIVVGGTFSALAGVTVNNLGRLNADGTFDPNFAIGSGPVSPVTALALQTDLQGEQKIVVAGSFTQVSGQRRSGLVRYTSKGILDLSFGAPFALGTPSTAVNVIRQLSDGAILLGQAGRQDFLTRVIGPLTVLENGPALAILTQPFGGTFNAGVTTQVLGVTAAGSGTLSYQWFRDGQPLADSASDVTGTKTNTLSFRNVQAIDAGVYKVVVTDSSGSSITSIEIAVAIRDAKPIATSQIVGSFGPVMQAGSSAYLSVTATGSTATAAWTRNGTPVEGGFYDNGTYYLPLPKVKLSDAGVYGLTLTNAKGSAMLAPSQFWVSEETAWTPHNPSPTPQQLLGVSVVDNQFLALGPLGTRVSFGAMGATQLPALWQNSLMSYVQGNGRRLILGGQGLIALSTDGLAWETTSLPTIENTVGANFGNGLFVVSSTYSASSSGQSKIFTSTDGRNWNQSYASASQVLSNVAFGNGIFAVATSAGVLRSTSGTTWELQANTPVTGASIRFVNNQFFILGNDNLLYVSDNAVNWTARSYPGAGARFIGFGGDKYILTGDAGLILMSGDAIAWDRRPSGTTANLRQAAYANNTWITVSPVNQPPVILTSTNNGDSWSNLTTSVTSENLHSLASDGTNHMIAVGPTGTILRTTDGTNWTPVSSGVTDELEGSAFGDGKYIVTGANGRILLSENLGLSWATVASGTSDYLDEASYVNGQFLVSGREGRLHKSTNGTTWSSVTVFSGGGEGSHIRDMTYGGSGANGRYIALSEDGRALISSDPSSWPTTTLNLGVAPGTDLEGVSYGNGKFLIVSSAGILSSTTGESGTWTVSPSPVIPDWDSGTLFINGQFYAGAGLNSFITSLDGVTWTGHHLGTTYSDINDVEPFQGRLYLTGERGLIISSGFSPAIVQQPVAPAFAMGVPATFQVIAAGSPEVVTYQWRRNGDIIAGATSATYTIASPTSASAGNYDVLGRTSSGVVASTTVTYGTPPPAGVARLLNTSIRGMVGPGENALLASFTIDSTGPKTVLARAGGPMLGALMGVPSALADPRLAIYDAKGALVASNDNWAAGLETYFQAVGALPFATGSADAALLIALEPGTYTARVTGANNATGVALLEVYDASGTGQRFDYVSARASVSDGSPGVMGFNIRAEAGPQTVLLRGLGASLVTGLGALGDARLQVFKVTAGGSTEIASNDNWGSNTNLSEIAVATTASGAMPLAASDAALLLSLETGSYLVQVSGASGTSGFVLAEAHLIDAQRAPQFAPALIAPLLNKTVNPNDPLYLNAPFIAKPGPTSIQWKKDGVDVFGSPLPDAPGAFFIPYANATDAGLYTVTITSTAGITVSVGGQVTVADPGGYGAVQRLVGAGYLPGQTIQVSQTIEYPSLSGGLQWAVTLPQGWTFASDVNSTANTKPTAGTSGSIVWSWTTAPTGPVTFTYRVTVPAGESASRHIIGRATVGSAMSPRIVNALPLAVSLLPTRHSADTNGDGRLTLSELTRVLDLYNTYASTARTGRYQVMANTEDGFAPDISASASASALAKYHSADSDRDGDIDLEELTRVIELYNVRQGTVRTGAHHVAVDTEDGFDLGNP